MKKSNKINVKKVIISLLLALGAFCYVTSGRSDQSIYDRVVKLVGPVGACTGEQIQAPSGEHYVLTAGHCKEIAEKGGEIITESGKHYPAVVIAEDPSSDLLLLMGIPNFPGLNIAKADYARQEIRTFTHGKGRAAYKTEGVLIQDEPVEIMVSEISSPEELIACVAQPKYDVIADMYSAICILKVNATISTAFVAPGSSGGPIVDANGDLVGVVSASGGGFSIFVRLQDIQAFLKDF